MRWMTYNIKLGERCGLSAVARVVRAARPDVLALQEVGSNWLDGPRGHIPARLAYATGLTHRVFVPTIAKSTAIRYGHALLARWPLVDVGLVPLTRRIDEPRKLLVARLIRPGGSVRIVATHLSHRQPDRRTQGGELLDLVDDRLDDARPTVVLGDFNEPADQPDGWLRDLLDRLDPARRLAPAPTFENPDPTRRIDYVMVHGARWSSARVVGEPDASDHRPVVAEF